MSARKDDPEAQLLGSSSTTQTPFLNQEPPSYSMIHEKAQSDARVCRCPGMLAQVVVLAQE